MKPAFEPNTSESEGNRYIKHTGPVERTRLADFYSSECPDPLSAVDPTLISNRMFEVSRHSIIEPGLMAYSKSGDSAASKHVRGQIMRSYRLAGIIPPSSKDDDEVRELAHSSNNNNDDDNDPESRSISQT